MKDFQEEMVQPEKIFFFPNGMLVAYDKDGLQITELQKLNYYRMLFKIIEDAGFDPTKCTYESGVNQYIVPFKTEEGEWNYEIKNK